MDSIAEQQVGSGEETDDDEEELDEAEELKTHPRKSADDSVIKSGYLWKKGERRKVRLFIYNLNYSNIAIDVEETMVRFAHGSFGLLQELGGISASAHG